MSDAKTPVDHALSPDLLAILRCPKCRGSLAQRAQGLVCGGCRLVYAIEDGIPNLLIDEARTAGPADLGEVA